MKTSLLPLAACGCGLLLLSVASAQAATTTADYPAAVLADSPIAYWRFNDVVVYPAPVLSTNLGSFGAEQTANTTEW